jgi:RNA polymerase sigma factor (sigma-70 family)
MDLDVHLPGIYARDPMAFARWMSACEPSVRESLRSFVTVVDVEAVLQEALLRVWRASPCFTPDGQPNALLRFAVRVARNLAISEVRRTKARPVEDETLERMTPPEEPAPPDPMLRGAIAECHGRLPEQPRRALDARLASDGSTDDVALAASLSMRLNTFLQNFGRARKLLAECLEKHGIRVAEELAR